VPILVFLGLSVLELGPMYATDRRQTDVRQKHRLMPPPYGGGSILCDVNEDLLSHTAVRLMLLNIHQATTICFTLMTVSLRLKLGTETGDGGWR